MKNVQQWLLENPLIEHDLPQGSPEWHAFRDEHDGSSEAAAMLALSKNTSRTEMLNMKCFGMKKEFSAWVQKNVLDYGHKVEALARPIIEKLIGSKLYPIVLSRGRMSASCDGAVMSGAIVWENKQPNAAIVEQVKNNILPEEHAPQCYQLLLVSGAEKLIFSVSDGTEENTHSMEVFPDAVWFNRIINGWVQFHKDREDYEPRHIVERPQAEVVIDLPALFIHAQGEITESNMIAYGAALATRLAEVRSIALVSDQDFSNAKEAAKKFREQCVKLMATKEAMLAQTTTIGEAALMIDAWHEDLRVTALQLETDVKREDLAKKAAMVNEAKNKFNEFFAALEETVKPTRLNVTKPDFAIAIKGKSKYASMQGAIDDMMARAEMESTELCKDVSDKLAWCKDKFSEFGFLFKDMQAIIVKPMEDFQLTVTSRVKDYKEAEAAKVEALRIAMQAEADSKAKAKAEAEAEAILVSERAKMEAEEREKVAAGVKAQMEEQAKQKSLEDIATAKMSEEVAIAEAAKTKTKTDEEKSPVGKLFQQGLEQKAESEIVATQSGNAESEEVKPATLRPSTTWPFPVPAKNQNQMMLAQAQEECVNFMLKYKGINELALVMDEMGEFLASTSKAVAELAAA